MIKLFRKKLNQDPSKNTKLDELYFPFFSRLRLILWPFAGKLFFEGIVVLASKMATSDGPVSEQELALFTSLLNTHFRLSKKQQSRARSYLFKAHKTNDNFADVANIFYKKFRRDSALLENAYDVLLSMAYADNFLSVSEQQFLSEVAAIFNLDSNVLSRLTKRYHNWRSKIETVEEQKAAQEKERAQAQFQKQQYQKQKQDSEKQDKEYSDSKSKYRQRANQQNNRFKSEGNKKFFENFNQNFHQNWYEILLVSRDATESQVKSSYRKLVRAYHPDALPSNIPADMMKASVERFLEIQNAYDEYLKIKK